MRRSCAELPNRRQPILPLPLLKIKGVLSSVNKRYRKTFGAACLVALYSLLWYTNLSKKSNSCGHLLTKDVTFTNDGAVLFAKVLKTNRFLSKRVEIPLLLLGSFHPLWPIITIQAMLESTGDSSNDTSFSYVKSDRAVPVSSCRFNAILLSTAKLAGVAHANIPTHSSGRGAATFASSMGILSDALKTQGNWKSSCFERYIHGGCELRNDFVAKLAKALRPLWWLFLFWGFWRFGILRLPDVSSVYPLKFATVCPSTRERREGNNSSNEASIPETA